MQAASPLSLFSPKIDNAPLLFFQPFNMLVFFAFYSPFVIGVVTVSLSFLFQNFKGFIFLIYLIFVSTIRNFVIGLKGGDTMNGSTLMKGSPTNSNDICTSVAFTRHGNQTYSCFVFAFTIMYMGYPMVTNHEVNYGVIVGLIVYGVFDVIIRVFTKCINSDIYKFIFYDTVAGLVASLLFVVVLSNTGNGRFLFFNEISSKEVCTKPSSETFKCTVAPNGDMEAAAVP